MVSHRTRLSRVGLSHICVFMEVIQRLKELDPDLGVERQNLSTREFTVGDVQDMHGG